jgi:hypothetical protein
VFTAASCSGSAPRLSRTASPSSGSSRPRRSLAAARRRRRGTQLAPPRLHFPGPFPLAAAHTRVRGKPQRGLVGCDCNPRLSYRVSVKAVWGQKVQGATYWWPWRAGRRGSMPVAAKPPLASPGKGKRGLSPRWIPLAGLRARWPRHVRQLSARLSHPRARPWREPAGASESKAKGKRMRIGTTSRLTRGPGPSARDG